MSEFDGTFDINADVAVLNSSDGCAPEHWDDNRLALAFSEWQRQNNGSVAVDRNHQEVIHLPTMEELYEMNLQEIDPEEFSRLKILIGLRSKAEIQRTRNLRAAQDAAFEESQKIDSEKANTVEPEPELTLEQLRVQRMKWWASRQTSSSTRNE
jgi:hypothetical protein